MITDDGPRELLHVWLLELGRMPWPELVHAASFPIGGWSVLCRAELARREAL